MLLGQIHASYRRLPRWVQLWVFGILVPVNCAAIFLISQPNGFWIAALAIGGMLPNLWVMVRDRGFSKLMALPHLILWPPLVFLLIWQLSHDGFDAGWPTYLALLILAVDVISLAFDTNDFRLWLAGDRKAA